MCELENIPDFIARLKYHTAEEGGRHTPAHSKYRPTIKFSFDDMYTSGQQIFIGKDQVLPGEEIDAKIKIASSNHFAGMLSEGDDFVFTEGPYIIGTGIIIELINPLLRKDASV